MGQAFHDRVTVERAVPIPMRDGVTLTADIYRPKGVDAPLPVLLMRLPYGRAIASTVTYKHPSWYAMQGYIVAIQDVRGCGTSAGDFYPFRAEYEDGYDTVQWCAQQLPGSNGKVGMYGFSYQGVTQFQAAVMQPPGLVTICPAMAAADLYRGWFYCGGALCLDFTLTWALQLTQNRAQFLRQEPLATQLFQAQKQSDRWVQYAPLSELELLRDEPLARFFFDWIGHPQADDAYWQDLNPARRFERYDLPALHVAGWADIFIEATLHAYELATQATTCPQHLAIGPWQHLPWSPRVGEVDFGAAAVSDIDRLQVDWFDFWLKGIDNGIVARSPVRSFAMGQNCWVDLPAWPPQAENATLYLHRDRALHSYPPSPDDPGDPDLYVYDPRLPTLLPSYGFCDRRAAHDRWDVLTYFAAPQTSPLVVAGTIEVVLHASTTAADTDWVVEILDCPPDGREMLVTIGVLRARYRQGLTAPALVAPGDVVEYRLACRPTHYTFAIGHRVGIAIASAAFPHIERHSNTAEFPYRARVSEFVEATQQVHRSAAHPSRVILPRLDFPAP